MVEAHGRTIMVTLSPDRNSDSGAALPVQEIFPYGLDDPLEIVVGRPYVRTYVRYEEEFDRAPRGGGGDRRRVVR
jgi:hypothetical protein